MKELKFEKPSQLGNVVIRMIIAGKVIFFKFNQTPQAEQVVKFYKERGAIIDKSANGEWIKVDIFSNRTESVVILGNEEIDLEEDSDEKIEEKLTNFYIVNYIKQGFRRVN